MSLLCPPTTLLQTDKHQFNLHALLKTTQTAVHDAKTVLRVALRHVALYPLLMALAAPALSQMTTWPTKAVRVIVPLAPSGGTDIVTRVFNAQLTSQLGQTFITDNRAGAGGTIGAELAARATPDGYTLIIVPASYAANAALYKLSYDPIKDIAPVSMLTTGPLILTVNPTVAAHSFTELIELARAKPGSITFGSSGSGSFSHLTAEMLRQMSKTDFLHIPYKGAGPALVDLLGGHIQMFFGSGPSTGGHIRAGRLRGLAVTTQKRLTTLPDLPTIGEYLPGYASEFWFGMWDPAGTPKPIILKLNQALQRILKQPDVIERLHTDGMQSVGSTPDAFARTITHDINMWTQVVKLGHITL